MSMIEIVPQFVQLNYVEFDGNSADVIYCHC